jgi:hypothetical protein
MSSLSEGLRISERTLQLPDNTKSNGSCRFDRPAGAFFIMMVD